MNEQEQQEQYFEVEGAVFRRLANKPLEVYFGNDEWKPYNGDPDRVLRMSNPMTLEEVQPYMDVKREATAE